MPYLLRELMQGSEKLVCVGHDCTVRQALKIMIEGDYSQLPVVDESGALKGLVSEQSIVRTQALIETSVNVLDLAVDQCMDSPDILSPDDDFFEVLERLERKYAVVIVEDGRPVGLLTDFDTTHYFRSLAEGLMWAQDIELGLREFIERAFPSDSSLREAIAEAFGKDKQGQPFKEYGRLTLGEHIRLVTAEKNWPKFARAFAPKDMFLGLMRKAIDVRNAIAHVRERAGKAELDALERAFTWLATRPKLPEPHPVQVESVQLSGPVVLAGNGVLAASGTIVSKADGAPARRRGKYEPLAGWLRSLGPDKPEVRVTFDDIEKLLGQPLPPYSARRHWWANDSVSRTQSIAWLSAGWRVADVDIPNREVTFERLRGSMLEQELAE
jgi:CBS domain-containing protein